MGTNLTELLGSPKAVGTVTNGILAAVHASLVSHPMLGLTQAEIKRRFDICLRWFKELRFERKFSIERCVDEMPKALRAELDGLPYQPHGRSLWMPEGAL